MGVAELSARARVLVDEWRHPLSAEPTPWATGLTVLGLVAVLVAALDVTLTGVLRADFGWIAVPANVLVAVGLAPSFLLLRARPVWRWLAYGTALGLVLAWIVLLAGVV